MKHHEISKSLNDLSISKIFAKKDWSEMIYQLANMFLILRVKNSLLKPDLCDYSDVYIVVKGRITAEEYNDAKTREKKLILKNNAPVRSCISKINNTFVDDEKDLDIVLTMYNP